MCLNLTLLALGFYSLLSWCQFHNMVPFITFVSIHISMLSFDETLHFVTLYLQTSTFAWYFSALKIIACHGDVIFPLLTTQSWLNLL